MEFRYTTASWRETFSYVSETGQRGYPPDTTTLNTKSTVGDSQCPGSCSVSRIAQVMPPISQRLTGFIQVDTSGTNVCKLYTVRQNFSSNQALASFTAVPPTSSSDTCPRICSITFKDGRTFTLSSFSCSNVPVIAPQTGCFCNQVVDIWIAVDHSTSISDGEMTAFKDFVTQFLNKLTISPTGVNVGMSWWHLRSGVNFNITGDRTGVVTPGLKNFQKLWNSGILKSEFETQNTQMLRYGPMVG
jgi:hypothetical protein